MRDYTELLYPSNFYHIYNRGNNKENIFKTEDNYRFFLEKWQSYLNNVVNVWSYCLMPNHFHFLIKIRSKEIISAHYDVSNFESISHLISNQFRRLFISYTKSFNNVFSRTGSLFQKPFKRVQIGSQNYLLTLIHYIHHNPIHHKFTNSYEEWNFSSYNSIISNSPTEIERAKVLNIFGGKDKFVELHQSRKDFNKIDHLLVE